jgi:hypothetical protein
MVALIEKLLQTLLFPIYYCLFIKQQYRCLYKVFTI